MRTAAPLFALALALVSRPALAQSDDTGLPPPPAAPPDAIDTEGPTPPPTPAPAPLPPPPAPSPSPAPDSAALPPAAPASAPDTSSAPESPSEIPPDDAPRPSRPPPPPRWYGWQIIVLDGTALANFATPLWPLSLPVYYLGAPVTHLAHKAPAKAALSEALRIFVPFGTGRLGAQIKHCDVGNTAACAHGIHPGAVIGAVAVSAFDIAVLGQRSVLETAPARPRPTVSVYAGGNVDRHGFTLTASGTF